MRKIIFLLGLVSSSLSLEAKSIFVDADSPVSPTQDGTSWGTAYTDLQDALAEAESGDSVFVAEGVYTPGVSRFDFFAVSDGVSLLGGYDDENGNGTYERDITNNPTVLSGDINGDDLATPAAPNAPGIFSMTNRLDNCYNVMRISNAGPTTILDGLIISGGHSEVEFFRLFNDQGAEDEGAGLLMESFAGTIKNCIFRNNFAFSSGGAIRMEKVYRDPDTNEELPNSLFENCSFENNECRKQAGAIQASRSTFTTFRNCQFLNNTADTAGALSASQSSHYEIIGSSFIGNVARVVTGGGAYSIGVELAPRIQDSIFRGNFSGVNGGALYVSARATPEIINCVFQGNSASRSGGALYSVGDSQPRIINCSFQGNSATGAQIAVGGGAIHIDRSSPVIENCVIWNNSDEDGVNTLGASILVSESAAQPASPTYRNCLIQNWDGTSADAMGSSESRDNYDGTLAANDPLFLAPVPPSSAPSILGNLEISQNSFIIDKGERSFNSLNFDLNQNVRRIGVIDLGAYEFQDLDILWVFDEDGDGTPYGLEQAIGTDPFVSDITNPKNIEYTAPATLSFGVNPDADPRTLWTIIRSSDLMDFSNTIYGPSATPPPTPFTDPSPPSDSAFYIISIGFTPEQ